MIERQLIIDSTWSWLGFDEKISISSSVALLNLFCSSSISRSRLFLERFEELFIDLCQSTKRGGAAAVAAAPVSLLSTALASVSLYLYLFPLLFPLSLFSGLFFLMSSLVIVSQSSFWLCFLPCLLWCKILIRAEGGNWLHGRKPGLIDFNVMAAKQEAFW